MIYKYTLKNACYLLFFLYHIFNYQILIKTLIKLQPKGSAFNRLTAQNRNIKLWASIATAARENNIIILDTPL